MEQRNMRKYSVIAFLVLGTLATTAAVPRTWQDVPAVKQSAVAEARVGSLAVGKPGRAAPDLLPLRPV